MSWQEKASKEVAFEIASRFNVVVTYADAAAILRAALPLIEVTPGMQEVVAAMKLQRIKNGGKGNKGIVASIVDEVEAALSHCAKETP
jgi:hypothetical protein